VNSPVGDSVANFCFPAGAGDKAGLFEDPQMLGDVRLGNSEAFSSFGNAAFVLHQPMKKPDPRRMSQSFKYFSGLEINRSVFFHPVPHDLMG